jgi:hypothetical protein
VVRRVEVDQAAVEEFVAIVFAVGRQEVGEGEGVRRGGGDHGSVR